MVTRSNSIMRRCVHRRIRARSAGHIAVLLPATYKPLGAVSLRRPNNTWRTLTPKVSINPIYDDPMEGWFAHVGARNVRVDGYVSKSC